jgi:hypothetical protein
MTATAHVGRPAFAADPVPAPPPTTFRTTPHTGDTIMRTTPTTPAEADAWITVLHRYGHLHRAEPGPDGTWTVQRTADSQPRTLHHPVLALDFVAEILQDVRSHRPVLPR